VIYTQLTVRLIAAIALAAVLVIGLVELLNWFDAGPGIAAAAICLTAAVGGTVLGYFADRLPEISRKRAAANLHRRRA
jgi:hypothetical protein